MDTQLSKFIDGWLTTSPTISDLCHSALVSCDTISSERIAPLPARDPPVAAGRGRALSKFTLWFTMATSQIRRVDYVLVWQWDLDRNTPPARSASFKITLSCPGWISSTSNP